MSKAIHTKFQAIQTKYLGPTNTRGARIKAVADCGTVTMNWDHALNADGNHMAAAVALATKFGWLERYTLIGGTLPDQSRAFVLVDSFQVGSSPAESTPILDGILSDTL